MRRSSAVRQEIVDWCEKAPRIKSCADAPLKPGQTKRNLSDRHQAVPFLSEWLGPAADQQSSSSSAADLLAEFDKLVAVWSTSGNRLA